MAGALGLCGGFCVLFQVQWEIIIGLKAGLWHHERVEGVCKMITMMTRDFRAG